MEPAEHLLPDDIAKAVTRGDLSPLTAWLDSNEGSVDGRDAKGRSVLMLAVVVVTSRRRNIRDRAAPPTPPVQRPPAR